MNFQSYILTFIMATFISLQATGLLTNFSHHENLETYGFSYFAPELA